MKNFANVSSLVFIIGVLLFSFVAILGVWDFMQDDVVVKSLSTIGVLGFVGLIVIVASSYFDKSEDNHEHLVEEGQTSLAATNDTAPSIFRSIRQSTLGVMIVSLVFLSFLGIMAIWEIFDGEVVMRSMSSIAIILFASIIIVGVCMAHERHPRIMNSKGHISPVFVIVVLILGWIMVGFSSF